MGVRAHTRKADYPIRATDRITHYSYSTSPPQPHAWRAGGQFSRQRTGNDGLDVSLVDDADAARVVHDVDAAHVHAGVGDARARDGHAAHLEDLLWVASQRLVLFIILYSYSKFIVYECSYGVLVLRM